MGVRDDWLKRGMLVKTTREEKIKNGEEEYIS